MAILGLTYSYLLQWQVSHSLVACSRAGRGATEASKTERRKGIHISE